MRQSSLFEDAPSPPARAARLPRLVPGPAAVLNRAQKQFNKLTAEVTALRELLRAWNDHLPRHHERVVKEIEPLQRVMKARRKDMVLLLDRALDQRALSRRERAKVHDILMGQLQTLLHPEDKAPDEALVRLFDKHSEISFEQARQDDLDAAKETASTLFGVDLGGDDGGAETPADLADLIARKMAAEDLARRQAAPGPTSAPPSGHKPGARSAKAAARAAREETAREQAAKGASQALREVYRKLASQLHPDREPDAAERARKTALMQQVNQAQESGDLLRLLELQLQVDAAALSNLAQDRLEHYNLVLREQLDSLRQELDALTGPYATAVGGPRHGPLRPEALEQALRVDLQQSRRALQALEEDLRRFADMALLKAALRSYRIGQDDDDQMPNVLELMLMARQAKGRRRR